MTNLPIHPLTGLTAIGWRKARRGEDGEQPIWPILGASDDDEADDDQDAADEGDDADESDGKVEGEDALGDAGKRALDKMKADLRAEKARRKAAEAAAEAAKTAAQQGTKGEDDKPDLEALKAAALAEARAETLRERALDRLEARAGRKNFADPADARVLLKDRLDDFLDGAQIDTQAIDDALDELLEAKSYLAATATKRFAGTGDGGARKGSTGPVQLTEVDMKKMTPEQIDEAHRKGQFDELLGKKR